MNSATGSDPACSCIALRIRPCRKVPSSSAETEQATATRIDWTKSFDRVFDTKSTQEEVFQETASNLVDKLFKGCNATLLVYGHPQSGKTYSLGTSLGDPIDEQQEGLIPRASHLLFEKLLLETSIISPRARSISHLRPTSMHLRPASFISIPQRRGSTSDLLISQSALKAAPAIRNINNSRAPRYTVYVDYESVEEGKHICLVDSVAVRSTGDVLRHLEKGASLNKTGLSTRFTLSLTTERWVAKPAPKRRISVRAMVGQMEKRSQDEDENGEWIKTEARISFIELHTHQTLSPKWVDALKCDTDRVLLLCLEKGVSQADAWIKHALSMKTMPISSWLHESPDERQEKPAIKVATAVPFEASAAVMSPSASTACSSTSTGDEDEDDICRPSSSTRTTLTIPDDDTAVVVDLKHKVEQLTNQVAATQERNAHVEAQLQQKNALDKERGIAIAQYLDGIERFAIDNTHVISLVRQFKKCILPPEWQANSLPTHLQEEIDNVRAELDQIRAEHIEAKASHTQAMEKTTMELNKARKDHGRVRVEYVKLLEDAGSMREKFCREIKAITSTLDQIRADKDLLEFQLEQAQQVNDELQAELGQTQEAKARLEADLVNSRVVNDTIASKLAKSIDANSISKTKLEDLQLQLASCRRHFDAEMQETKAELETVRSTLTTERKAFQSTIASLTAELQTSQAQVCEYTEELRAFQALATDRITEAENQMRAFQKLERTQTAVISRLTDKIAGQAELIETMTLQLESQDECVALLENDKQEAEETVEHLERELKNIGEDRASLQRLIEYVDKALCRTTEETDRINEQLLVDIKPHLEAIEQERLELLQKLEEQTRQIELYRVDEGEIRSIIVGLESRLQSLQQSQTADKTELDQARMREAEAVKISESLVDKIAQLAQENAQLQSQLNKVSPRGSLASLPPPSAPPSNPLPPIPSTLPALPGTSVGSRPQSPPTPLRSTSLLQRQNSNNTIFTGSIATADLENATTPEKYERIIQALQRKMQAAETDVKAHQDVISKLESQLSRYEHMVREIKRQVDVLSREKQASSLEIQNLRSQVSSHQETARKLDDYKSLESQLSRERHLKEKAERAKMILENRMEELMNQRKSKFMCF
ncbi:hypothetical protein BX666DRAFT_1995597 [Dichotomocladium elegans]|nr:hypothetical protein BX666DRAFT_1995597 [Dichotomocladium elegans]